MLWICGFRSPPWSSPANLKNNSSKDFLICYLFPSYCWRFHTSVAGARGRSSLFSKGRKAKGASCLWLSPPSTSSAWWSTGPPLTFALCLLTEQLSVPPCPLRLYIIWSLGPQTLSPIPRAFLNRPSQVTWSVFFLFTSDPYLKPVSLWFWKVDLLINFDRFFFIRTVCICCCCFSK